MIEAYEQLILLEWMARVAQRLDRFRWLQDGFARLVADEADHLMLDLPEDLRQPESEQLTQAIRKRIAELGKPEPSTLEANLRAVAGLLQLSPPESLLMGALVRTKVLVPVEELFEVLELDEIRAGDSGAMGMLSTLLGMTRAELLEALSPRGRLLASGLFTVDFRSDCQPLPALIRFLQSQPEPLADVRVALLGDPLAHSLEWDDYEHLREDRDLAATLLQRAVSGQERGIHVLLYGPPGTGKTEFCKTLAAKLGVKLYGVGMADEHGQEPSRDERVGAYRLSQKLLESQSDALLLFDEAEDLLRGDYDDYGGERSGYGSRVFMHRLFEDARVPTLWTVNDPSALGPSVLRRMQETFVVFRNI